jgi:hypothetical protein
MDLAVGADKLSGIGVEGELAKAKFHNRTHRKPMDRPEVAQDCRRERPHISGSGGRHELACPDRMWLALARGGL